MLLKNVSRRSFLTTVTGGIAAATAAAVPFGNIYRYIDNKNGDSLKLGVFDVDATPPVSSLLTYDPMINSSELGLRARGVVITGAGLPIVLCAVDWIGISNESQDVFKQAIAEAAATASDRVAVHTVHQHDAPICDFTAERLLKEKNLPIGCFDGTFARVLIKRLQKSIANSLLKLQDVTHIGLGKAPVFQVASNRRVDIINGKMGVMRGSSCSDPRLRNMSEGVVDPDVSLLSFWNKNIPLAVLSFYATHPQSYYRTGIANPDFPGIARYLRQLEVPDALHVHFNGAGGNIAAGKYNDGSRETRFILAKRLADGMKRAWENTQRYSVNSGNVTWSVTPVLLPSNPKTADIEKEMATKDGIYLANNLGRLGWYKRTLQRKAIGFACLGINDARIFFMPGELFVEYQLAAKAKAPDRFVAMAAYGDYGPFYIGTRNAYREGGYEILSSPVTENAEGVIMRAIDELFNRN
ncbi:MAG: hypothetical protein PHV83_00620 [Bacteroidales bacterium]|jgi:hypothetical protein|nr:hypothetical protein [Bacteroidales bacterium]